MGYTYEKSFWEEILCNASENSQCWLSECDLCRDGQEFKPQKPMDAIVNYKQWKSIHTPVNSKESQEKYQDQPPKIFKKFQVTREVVPVGQVFDEFKQSFEDVVSHKGQVNLSKGFSR